MGGAGAAAALISRAGGALSAPRAQSATPFGEPTTRGGTYVYGMGGQSEPRNFVGTSYYGTTAFFFSKLLYTPLVTLDSNWQNLGPAIATEWSWSDDSLHLTMKLRQDVKFHDGTALTAKDVEFTTKLMARADAYPAVQSISIFEGGTDYRDGTTDEFPGVTAVDDYTVQFNLSAPSNVFLRNLGNMGILPAAAFGPEALAAGTDIATLPFFDGKAIGTGPFKIGDYDASTHLDLVPHTEYYKGAPILDGITFRFGLAAPAQVSAIQAGEVDGILAASPQDAVSLRDNDALELRMNYAMANETVITPANEKPYMNIQVKQALLTALDIETLIATIGYGIPQPAPAVIMHSSLFPNPDLPVYAYDPERAKALLAEGGWDASQKLKLGRFTDQGSPLDLDSAIMTMWKAVGVETEYLPLDPANSSGVSVVDEHEYDALITGFAWLAYEPSSSSGIFNCDRRPNQNNYCNADFDATMQEAIRTLDPAASTALYQKAQTILQTELATIPLWIEPEIFVISKRVHGGVFGRGPINDVQAELWWKE
jgi:peptide/nickel transport system substrate-binding protein